MAQETAQRQYRVHQTTMVALAAVCFFASAPGQSFLISVFVDDFLAGTGLSRTTFSALFAAGTIVSAVSMLILGRIIDRRGLRVAWIIVVLALAAACGFASIAAGAVTAFLALALIRTFGQGSCPLLGTLLVARNFRHRRGQAMAIANLGVTSSSVILPPIVATLILTIGWRHTYQVLGLGVLVLMLPLAFFLRSGPPRPESTVDPAEHTRQYPDATRTFGRFHLELPSRSAARMLIALASPPLVATALTFHAVSILSTRGLSFLQAGIALSILGVTSATGTVLYGLVADRVSNRTLLSVMNLTVLAGAALLFFPHSITAYAGYGVMGLAMGGNGVANGTVWARTFGLRQLGRIQGTAQSSMITAAAAAPLIPAISHGATDSYIPSLVVLTGFTLITTVTASRITESGR